jgi:2-desacetyl-2-hydroxyethyl bacteriochlorophyllide A dehydrogenase
LQVKERFEIMIKNYSLFFKEPYKVEIYEDEIPVPQPDELLIRTITSAVSSGTEMLVYRGQIPDNIAVDETIDALKDKFQYPLRYGYASVGEIIETGNSELRNLVGKKVFAFQPHGSFFITNINNTMFIPDGINVEDAVFYPNLETAVNLLMDGRPVVGEDVIVTGAGIVGLFTIALLKQYPINSLTVIEPLRNRQSAVKELGADNVYHPDEFNDIIRIQQSGHGIDAGVDLVFECSGAGEALQMSIDAAGFNGRVIAGSWYGNKPVTLDLGSRFHRQRIKLISSQVSSITPEQMSRWNHKRRADVVWKQLERIKPSRWITHRFPLPDAQIAYQLIDEHPEQCLQVLFTYF